MPKALENLYDDNCFACPDGYTTNSVRNVVEWKALSNGSGALDYITVPHCPISSQGAKGNSLSIPGQGGGSGCGICVPKNPGPTCNNGYGVFGMSDGEPLSITISKINKYRNRNTCRKCPTGTKSEEFIDPER